MAPPRSQGWLAVGLVAVGVAALAAVAAAVLAMGLAVGLPKLSPAEQAEQEAAAVRQLMAARRDAGRLP